MWDAEVVLTDSGELDNLQKGRWPLSLQLLCFCSLLSLSVSLPHSLSFVIREKA